MVTETKKTTVEEHRRYDENPDLNLGFHYAAPEGIIKTKEQIRNNEIHFRI